MHWSDMIRWHGPKPALSKIVVGSHTIHKDLRGAPFNEALSVCELIRSVGRVAVDTTPFTIHDIVEVLGTHVLFGDYAETTCYGCFKLFDGRYASIRAWCDTTGWD